MYPHLFLPSSSDVSNPTDLTVPSEFLTSYTSNTSSSSSSAKSSASTLFSQSPFADFWRRLTFRLEIQFLAASVEEIFKINSRTVDWRSWLVVKEAVVEDEVNVLKQSWWSEILVAIDLILNRLEVHRMLNYVEIINCLKNKKMTQYR